METDVENRLVDTVRGVSDRSPLLSSPFLAQPSSLQLPPVPTQSSPRPRHQLASQHSACPPRCPAPTITWPHWWVMLRLSPSSGSHFHPEEIWELQRPFNHQRIGLSEEEFRGKVVILRMTSLIHLCFDFFFCFLFIFIFSFVCAAQLVGS